MGLVHESYPLPPQGGVNSVTLAGSSLRDRLLADYSDVFSNELLGGPMDIKLKSNHGV